MQVDWLAVKKGDFPLKLIIILLPIKFAKDAIQVGIRKLKWGVASFDLDVVQHYHVHFWDASAKNILPKRTQTNPT